MTHADEWVGVEPGPYIDLARNQGPEAAYEQWILDNPGATHHQRWQAVCTLMRGVYWRVIAPDTGDAIDELYDSDADLSSGKAATAEWRWAACRHAGTGDAHQELIWAIRPMYHHIWTYAKSRLVSPWAVLGATLTRVVATVPPYVKIQPDRDAGGTGLGSWASLNTFVALVGPPGAGKNAGLSVSREAVLTPAIDMEPLGSGEGIAHMFMRRPRPTRDEPDPQPVMYRSNVIVTIGEVDAFAAVAGRRGSTLGAQVRAAAMGEKLGFFYVDTTRRMPVEDHTYRLCLIAGVQPKRSGVLLSGPEASGGTPQRFIWLPATDPYITKSFIPATPAPLQWIPPNPPRALAGVAVCDEVREYVLDQRIAQNLGQVEEDDAHLALMRVKVAVALALLDGRVEVAIEDWLLSRLVMDVSASTRGECKKALAEELENANDVAGRAEARRAQIVDESAEERTIARVCNAVLRKIQAGGGVSVSAGDVRRVVSSRDRSWFDAAVLRLEETKTIIVGTALDATGRTRTVLTLASKLEKS